VDITNTGSREGDEVPQLYLHQRVASVTRPVMQLKASSASPEAGREAHRRVHH
jgi:beta-glucosidase